MFNDMHLTGGSIEFQTYRGRPATHATENNFVHSYSDQPLLEGRDKAAALLDDLCVLDISEAIKERCAKVRRY